MNILYEDDHGTWCPLRSLYWSQASKVLVSRNISSCIEEVVSHYCPQCCTRYSDEETNAHYGKCPTCFQCPRCTSMLSITPSNELHCRFECVYCAWASIEYSASVNDKAAISLEALKYEVDISQSNAFNSILTRMKASSDSQIKITAMTSLSIEQPSASQPNNTSRDLNTQYMSSLKLSEYNDTLSNLKPVRTSLRSKKMTRCRNDFEASKMNILIQPKNTPLEGDSSMRIQRGKWWMKDSSAIHEIPSVTFLEPVFINSGRANIRIMISNPKESEVHCTLRFPKAFSHLLEPFPSLWDGLTPRVISNYVPAMCLSKADEDEVEFDLILGPLEDELLRDDEDESIANKIENKVESSVSNIPNILVRHNVAYATLPISALIDNSSYVCLDMILIIKKIGDDIVVNQQPIKIRICI